MTPTSDWWFGLLMATTGVFGCSALPTEEPPPVVSVVLDFQGTVTSQPTGSLLAGATVGLLRRYCSQGLFGGLRCEDEFVRSVTTGQDAKYRLAIYCSSQLELLFYSVWVYAPGHQSQSITLGNTGLLCTTAPQTLDLVLVPISAIPQ